MTIHQAKAFGSWDHAASAVPAGPPPSPVHRVASARALLEPGCGPARAGRPAIWHWDLASGRVEWNEGLKANFGYADKVTDAAWREERIHPEDRKRVQVSLQRATIANPGAEWSDRYRLLQADGSYASVTERAYVVHDDAGPCEVLGAITRASRVARPRTEEVP